MAVREKTREQRPSETTKSTPVSNTVRSTAAPAQVVSKRPLVDAQKGDPAARARAAIAMQKQAGNARTGAMMKEAAAKAAEPKTTPKINVVLPTLVKAPTTVPHTVAKPVVSKEASKTIVTTTMSLGTAKPQEIKPGMVQPASPVAGEKQIAPAVGGKGPATPATPASSAAPAPEPPSETPKPTAPEAAPKVEEKKDAKAEGEKKEKEKTAEGAKPEAKEGEKEKPKVPSAREAVGPAVTAVHHRAKGAHKKSPPGEAVTNAELSAKVPASEAKRVADKETVYKLGDEAEKAPNVQRQKFVDTLVEAIDRRMGNPKSESQAEHVMKEGAKEANAEVSSHLAEQSEATENPLRDAAATEVTPTTAEQKVDFKPEEVGQPPKPVSAAPVVPEPLPDERLDYSSDREPTDKAMAENNVSKEQLEKGNEPAFNKNLEERSSAEANEAKMATRYRETEKKIQGRTHAVAAKALSGGLGEIHGSRDLHIKGVVGQQKGTKDKGAAERTRINNEINGIKERTRTKVKVILQVMEAIAPTIFSIGLQAAEGLYAQVFDEEKGGVGTWLTTWGDDWEELIENSLATAKSAYKIRVRKAINDVADFVDGKLGEARKAVENGRKEVDTFVQNLADNVKQYGLDAQKLVDEDFAAMDQEIDSRRDALVEALVDQYKASYERMSAMEEKLREENKSLWQRIYDATIGLIKKIIAFKDMLVSILRKAAELIIDIITDPIGFLGNLIDGVMLGLENFMKNLPRHLLQGLMKWLFGALGEAGLEMPESFDLEGIVKIILQIFGLTYANFRKRAVDIVGEPVVSAIEKTAEVFKVVMTEGIPGIWRLIKEKVLELKSMVLDAIFDFIKEKVLVAGVTWIIGLLNPVSAFFKACKAIYDIVVFFIERGSQIIDLVNAIIDSISAIVKGNISVAAKMVEDALAKAIPVAIGFLASLLGLGNISGTIRKTIDKAREPVNKAIDWVINLAVKGVKAAGKAIAGAFGKKQPKPEEPKGPADQHPDQHADLRTQVAHTLGERLKSAHTREAAIEIVEATEKEYKGLGLKSLEVGPETEEGTSPILAEASPKLPLAELIHDVPRPKGRSVTSRVQVTLEEDVDVGAIELAPVDRQKATVQTGGVVWTPSTRASTKINAVTWNTSNINPPGNSSHAEHQFVNYMESREDLWSKVQKIVVVNVTRSPCSECGPELGWLLKRIKKARKGKPVEAEIFWTKLHSSGAQPTSWESLHDMQKEGWKLHAPGGEYPPEKGPYSDKVFIKLI